MPKKITDSFSGLPLTLPGDAPGLPIPAPPNIDYLGDGRTRGGVDNPGGTTYQNVLY